MLSNPPYGKSWKSDLERMGGKDGIKDPRFIIQHARRSGIFPADPLFRWAAAFPGKYGQQDEAQNCTGQPHCRGT